VLAYQNAQTRKILALEEETARARARHYYFNCNTRAFGKWLTRDVRQAEGLLEQCPEELRQWEWNYLKRLCHAELFSLRGQAGPAAAVAFGPGGKYLAWAGPDLTVRVTDVASRHEAFALRGHTAAVSSLAFGPAGTRLASASQDGTVRLWELGSGKEVGRFGGRHGPVHGVALGPGGKRLASAGSDGKVRVWGVGGGRPVHTLQAGGRPVLGVAFSADGKWLASGGEDGKVRVWEAETGRNLHTTASPDGGPVRGVAFSPDGSRLAAGRADGRGWLLDPRTGDTVSPLPGHTGAVTGVAYSREGPYLATGSKDGTAALWQATTGARVRTYRHQTGPVTAVAVSPNGNYLASAGEGGTVKVWDGTRDPMYRTLPHPGAVLRVAFSPDGKFLASASFEQLVKVWDRRAGDKPGLVWQRRGLGACVAFSPDSKLLAVGGEGGKVTLCEPAKGKPVGFCQAHEPGHVVRTLAFGRTPAGLLLASGAGHGGVKVWRVSRTGDEARPEYKASVAWQVLPPGGKPPSPLPRAGWGQVLSVAFSPDGRSLAAADLGGTVEVFEATTGKLLFSLQEPGREIQCVAFSPAGDYLAAAVWYDCAVKVWDWKRRAELCTLGGHTGRVTSVAFSGTGERLRLGGLRRHRAGLGRDPPAGGRRVNEAPRRASPRPRLGGEG
jgi:WD40 repeat protein